MNGNDFEVIDKIKDFNTFYFIDSHLKSLNNDIEIIIDNHKYLKSLRKISEKTIKDNKNQEFTVSVYGIDFKPNLIKPKDLK